MKVKLLFEIAENNLLILKGFLFIYFLDWFMNGVLKTCTVDDKACGRPYDNYLKFFRNI